MALHFSMARVSQTLKRFTFPVINRIRFGFGKYSSEKRGLDDLAFASRVDNKTPVFVYQMGKVASTAIYQGLLKTESKELVFHSHSFEPFHTNKEIRLLFRYYQKYKPPIRIISLVREPVTRNISAFFQNLRRDANKKALTSELPIEKIKSMFLRNYPHEIPLIWFDNNIKKHFDIDVYEREFPKAGYLKFQKDNVELLLMRHDLANVTKELLIGEFTGVSGLKLSQDNVGNDKRYAELYAKFKETKLPLSHLFYLASSKYMKHFFYPEMRQILESWSEEGLP